VCEIHFLNEVSRFVSASLFFPPPAGDVGGNPTAESLFLALPEGEAARVTSEAVRVSCLFLPLSAHEDQRLRAEALFSSPTLPCASYASKVWFEDLSFLFPLFPRGLMKTAGTSKVFLSFFLQRGISTGRG